MLKEDIIDLFYIEHFSTKDIAEKFNISSAYVSKIIKLDERYENEKQYRKQVAKEKRKLGQNRFVKNKRERQRSEDDYRFVQYQHAQASRQLSESNHLTNENYRKWNCSAYNYNPSKRRYEFDQNLGRASDVPKYIKER